MKRIHSSWYHMGMLVGGLSIGAVYPLAGAATGLAFYKLYRGRKQVEDAERAESNQLQRERFKRQFYGRQKYPSYEDYLQSDEWRAKRALVIVRACGRCETELCNRNAEEVHHKWYPRTWGTEGLSSLVALCHEHHMAQHRE